MLATEDIDVMDIWHVRLKFEISYEQASKIKQN